MFLTSRKNFQVVRIQHFLLEHIIVPIIVNIAFTFFSITVMFLKIFFPDSISGTYLQLFFQKSGS